MIQSVDLYADMGEGSGPRRMGNDTALAAAPGTPILVLAGLPQEAAAEEAGAVNIHEIFVDRAYNDEATLVDRS